MRCWAQRAELGHALLLARGGDSGELPLTRGFVVFDLRKSAKQFGTDVQSTASPAKLKPCGF